MNIVIESFGWTLVHSVWECALIWLGLQIALAAMRRSEARIRYLVSFSALILAVVLPCLTYLWLDSREHGAVAMSIVPLGTPSGAFLTSPGLPMTSPLTLRSLGDLIMARLAAALPWLVVSWAVGCAWNLAGLWRKWTATQRLGSAERRSLGERVETRCLELARRLGIYRMIQFGESALVDVPCVVTWLKPVILVPVGAFSGLLPEQVDAILAHELAHIVRHDFAANLLQSACEVIFFYHPGIRAINSRIRIERENACDDIAIALTGNPRGYAEALTKLEESRCPSLTLAVTGRGSLLPRIRRLLAVPPVSGRPIRPSIWAIFASTAFVGLLLVTPGIAIRVLADQPSGHFKLADKPVLTAQTKKVCDEVSALITTKKWDEAISLLDAQVRQVDGDSYDAVVIENTLGGIYWQGKVEPEKALAPWEAMLRISADHPSYLSTAEIALHCQYLANAYLSIATDRKLNDEVLKNVAIDKSLGFFKRYVELMAQPKQDDLLRYASLLYTQACFDKDHVNQAGLLQAQIEAEAGLAADHHPKRAFYELLGSVHELEQDPKGAAEYYELGLKNYPNAKADWTLLATAYLKLAVENQSNPGEYLRYLKLVENTYERAQAGGALNDPANNAKLASVRRQIEEAARQHQ